MLQLWREPQENCLDLLLTLNPDTASWSSPGLRLLRLSFPRFAHAAAVPSGNGQLRSAECVSAGLHCSEKRLRGGSARVQEIHRFLVS